MPCCDELPILGLLGFEGDKVFLFLFAFARIFSQDAIDIFIECLVKYGLPFPIISKNKRREVETKAKKVFLFNLKGFPPRIIFQ